MNMHKEIARLERMTVGELHGRYVEVFGEAARSRHRVYLIRRIAWRLQANAEGGLSERAQRRAAELADVADVRVTPPRAPRLVEPEPPTEPPCRHDPRLPPVGTAITRVYKGRRIAVKVRADGLVYDGERYASLSAVAKAITGSHVNGFRFFGLEAKA